MTNKDFPKVRMAIEKRKIAMEAQRKLGPTPGFHEREARVEHKRVIDAADAAYVKVVDAYIAELLPAITDIHSWKRSRYPLHATRAGERRKCYVEGEYHGLFDHPLTFRYGRGTKTWHSTVLIGQPYPEVSEAMALDLCASFPVSVWVRDDLSGWYPGWTALVIAGDRCWLKPEDAPRFGFKALGMVMA